METVKTKIKAFSDLVTKIRTMRRRVESSKKLASNSYATQFDEMTQQGECGRRLLRAMSIKSSPVAELLEAAKEAEGSSFVLNRTMLAVVWQTQFEESAMLGKHEVACGLLSDTAMSARALSHAGKSEKDLCYLAEMILEDGLCRCMTKIQPHDVQKPLTEHSPLMFIQQMLDALLAEGGIGRQGSLVTGLERPLRILHTVLYPDKNVGELQKVLTELTAIDADPGRQEAESALLLHLVRHATGQFLLKRAQTVLDKSEGTLRLQSAEEKLEDVVTQVIQDMSNSECKVEVLQARHQELVGLLQETAKMKEKAPAKHKAMIQQDMMAIGQEFLTGAVVCWSGQVEEAFAQTSAWLQEESVQEMDFSVDFARSVRDVRAVFKDFLDQSWESEEAAFAHSMDLVMFLAKAGRPSVAANPPMKLGFADDKVKDLLKDYPTTSLEMAEQLLDDEQAKATYPHWHAVAADWKRLYQPLRLHSQDVVLGCRAELKRVMGEFFAAKTQGEKGTLLKQAQKLVQACQPSQQRAIQVVLDISLGIAQLQEALHSALHSANTPSPFSKCGMHKKSINSHVNKLLQPVAALERDIATFDKSPLREFGLTKEVLVAMVTESKALIDKTSTVTVMERMSNLRDTIKRASELKDMVPDPTEQESKFRSFLSKNGSRLSEASKEVEKAARV